MARGLDVALITYRTRRPRPPGARVRRHQHVALAALKLDYSGGWGSRVADWRTFRNACPQLRRPAPAVPDSAACTHAGRLALGGPAVGADQAELRRRVGARELRIAHWRGDAAQLEIHTTGAKDHDGRGRHWHHLFGRYTYNGAGVYGSHQRHRRAARRRPQLYVDSLDADYGPGWRRVNAFVSRRPRPVLLEFGPKLGLAAPRPRPTRAGPARNQSTVPARRPRRHARPLGEFAGPPGLRRALKSRSR